VILLSSVGIGLLVGLVKAKWKRGRYYIPPLRYSWLAVIAYGIQLLAASLANTNENLTKDIFGITLVISIGMLLVFVWLNRHMAGMPILLIGLVLNLAVIAANGGLMPISPQTASHLVGHDILTMIEPGDRLGEKDILLPIQDTKLAMLSDRFLLPDWFPYQVAFSLGDVLIGSGAFWFLVADHRNTRIGVLWLYPLHNNK
jgi:hypothetical protein